VFFHFYLNSRYSSIVLTLNVLYVRFTSISHKSNIPKRWKICTSVACTLFFWLLSIAQNVIHSYLVPVLWYFITTLFNNLVLIPCCVLLVLYYHLLLLYTLLPYCFQKCINGNCWCPALYPHPNMQSIWLFSKAWTRVPLVYI